MERIIWTDHVRNAMLRRVREEKNIVQMIKSRKDNWIVHILRRNYLSKDVIEG
jgi:hypothetical protein